MFHRSVHHIHAAWRTANAYCRFSESSGGVSGGGGGAQGRQRGEGGMLILPWLGRNRCLAVRPRRSLAALRWLLTGGGASKRVLCKWVVGSCVHASCIPAHRIGACMLRAPERRGRGGAGRRGTCACIQVGGPINAQRCSRGFSWEKGTNERAAGFGIGGGVVSACLGRAWIVGRGVLDRGPRPPWAGLDGLLSETLIFFRDRMTRGWNYTCRSGWCRAPW